MARSSAGAPTSAGGARTRAPRRGTLEELASGRDRSLLRGTDATRCRRLASEHLRELGDPGIVVMSVDLRDGSAVALALGDPEVGICMRRDLREMRHAQHLVTPTYEPHAPPDRIR